MDGAESPSVVFPHTHDGRFGRRTPSAKHVPSSSQLAYWLLGRSDVGSPAVWLEASIESLTSLSGASRSRTPVAQTIDITVGPNGQNSFAPDPVSINVGDTVRWTFASVGHDVVSGPSCTPDNRFCWPSNTNCGNNGNGSIAQKGKSQSVIVSGALGRTPPKDYRPASSPARSHGSGACCP